MNTQELYATTIEYKLSERALAVLVAPVQQTKQRAIPTQNGTIEWRSASVLRPNTRYAVLGVLRNKGDATLTALVSAVKVSGVPLNSGTPTSYIRAFVNNGYLVPIVNEPKAKGEPKAEPKAKGEPKAEPQAEPEAK